MSKREITTETCLDRMLLSGSSGFTKAVNEGQVIIKGKYLCDEKLPFNPEENDEPIDISCVGYDNPGCPITDNKPS